MFKIHNKVLLLLVILLVAALMFLPIINYAPNRLVSGESLGIGKIPGSSLPWLVLCLGLLAGLSLLPNRRLNHIATLLLSQGLFIGLLILMGYCAANFAGQGSPLARTSPGSGLWLMFALCLLLCADVINRLTQSVFWRLVLNVQVWIIPVILLLWGEFDSLSLMKEYVNRQEIFDDAFSRHFALLLGTLLPGLLIGIPLGTLCHRRTAYQATIFSVLNVIQTVPSVALFGLLIVPLSGLVAWFPALGSLGISGIGVAPALIALVLYALLPIVRGVVSGLGQIPRNIYESAEGMGMSSAQIFWRAEVPLALPVLLRSVRVVSIQTIGMAVIAALIGAGGFGTIIFQGLLSSALDLVLLGVVPTIAMAVIIDALFKLLISFLEVKK